MKKIFGYADEFIKQSDWRDLALIKFCLCSIGIMWGMALPKRVHKPVALAVVSVFAATYIPLMLKFFRIMGIANREEMEKIEN